MVKLRAFRKMSEAGSLEGLEGPLSVFPGMVVLGILTEDDLSQPELLATITQPLHYYSTVVPVKRKKMKLGDISCSNDSGVALPLYIQSAFFFLFSSCPEPCI